jgi:hypothetical protein
MTDHDPKKPIATQRPRPVTAASEASPVRRGSAPAKGYALTKALPGPADPFDDDGLDALLAEQLEEGAEAQLLIVDRLLNRMRLRREV